jgi:starch synthase (maltosyl-transferring)
VFPYDPASSASSILGAWSGIIKEEMKVKGPAKTIIYNLFPLLAGRFAEWEKHFSRAASMGFNWIFVNPIQLPGFSGSLYAIKDYFAFNPLFLDEQSKEKPSDQVKAMLRAADSLGLKVMIDLVINHCAIDSDLLKSHPDWFLWESKGKVVHPFAMDNGNKVVWGDLAKFDHEHSKDQEGLFQFFLNLIKSQLELGFRGFRCDAAYQIPGRIWQRLIKETKKIDPGILFFAETLGCTPDQTKKTAQAGFDYVFNSAKWWDFKSRWLMKQYALIRDTVPSVSFAESHDTARLCEELKGNENGVKQRYLFTALFSTGVMMPIGFEFGFRKKMHVVKTRPEDWEDTHVVLTPFISEVNRIKSRHAVFQEEAPTEMIPNDNPNILLMWKASGSTQEESLLILNKDIYNKQHVSIDCLDDIFQAGMPITDISPESRMDLVPSRLSRDLQPGQGIVLSASRKLLPED